MDHCGVADSVIVVCYGVGGGLQPQDAQENRSHFAEGRTVGKEVQAKD